MAKLVGLQLDPADRCLLRLEWSAQADPRCLVARAVQVAALLPLDPILRLLPQQVFNSLSN